MLPKVYCNPYKHVCTEFLNLRLRRQRKRTRIRDPSSCNAYGVQPFVRHDYLGDRTGIRSNTSYAEIAIKRKRTVPPWGQPWRNANSCMQIESIMSLHNMFNKVGEISIYLPCHRVLIFYNYRLCITFFDQIPTSKWPSLCFLIMSHDQIPSNGLHGLLSWAEAYSRFFSLFSTWPQMVLHPGTPNSTPILKLLNSYQHRYYHQYGTDIFRVFIS